jgi:hypothetical protein
MFQPFDPRFQRSSTDPYARAPRLGAIKSKLRPIDDQEAKFHDPNRDDVRLPGSLWSASPQVRYVFCCCSAGPVLLRLWLCIHYTWLSFGLCIVAGPG